MQLKQFGGHIITVGLVVACGARSELTVLDTTTVAAIGGATQSTGGVNPITSVTSAVPTGGRIAFASGGQHTTGGVNSGVGGTLIATGGTRVSSSGGTASGGKSSVAGGTFGASGGRTSNATGATSAFGGKSTGGATATAGGITNTSGGTVAATSTVINTGGSADAGADASAQPDCIIRVAETGSDAGVDSNWASAFSTVQEGLDAASGLIRDAACDAVEVWVAAGTYKPTQPADPADPRTATFQLVAGVALYGGFAGTESARTDKSDGANTTILSGDIGTPGDRSDNSYHVVTGATGATLDGFTITGGFNMDGAGGGMYNDAASPLVTNCIFSLNTALTGGGMYNRSASPVVHSCTFADNNVNNGGGMYNDASSPMVTNCAFKNNTANFGEGAGMYNTGSSPQVTSCTFSYNSAQSAGAGMFNGDSSSPVVTDCTFADNSADAGGGMLNDGSSPVVKNCTFSRNGAYVGGGMDSYSSAPVVTNCAFLGNTGYVGGGMYNSASTVVVTNSVLASNSVSGTTKYSNESHASGGGMFNDYTSLIVTGCTFAHNSATYLGGGMFNENSSSPIISNSIFWDNSVLTDISEIIDGTQTFPSIVSYCVVRGGFTSGTNVMTADPLFIGATNTDLRLQANSPAIDAGNGCAPQVTLTDQEGNPRWDIASIPNAVNSLDIGAFEYQGILGVDSRVDDFSCN